MAKEQLVVNGYRVPGGHGGVAVRRACEMVAALPGITQKELLAEAIRYSGLSASTAGWITSPGSKSPAGLLWDRHREGVFKCYPNEHTERVVGAQAALFDEIMNITRLQHRGAKFRPVPGDLVNFHSFIGDPYVTGFFIGYGFGRHEPGDPIFSSIDDIIKARPPCRVGDRVDLNIIENGTGHLKKAWMLGNVTQA
jgi:hypothetical protein